MKKFFGVGLLIAALAVPALAASLEFRLSPQGQATDKLPIKSVFYVVLVGTEDGVQPSLFIWNLQKNWSSTVVGPKRVGDALVWGPIQLKRECDEVREGVAEVITADIGDMLVAAVDLQGKRAEAPQKPELLPPGPSATVRVGFPAPQERGLSVLRDGKSVEELRKGVYRVELVAPDLDRYCTVEKVSLILRGPQGKTAQIPLEETGPATGVFAGELEVRYAVEDCTLKASVGPISLQPGQSVVLRAASRELELAVAALPVSLKATLGEGKAVGIVDVGQRFSVSITPADYDEVRWCLDGKGVAGNTFSLEEPGGHTLVAFVRKGDVWGQGSLSLEAIPGTVIAPVGREAATIEALGYALVQASAEEKLCFTLENAADDPHPVVYVGKLGKGCPNEVKVGPDGRFQIDLRDLGVQAGDTLWIYYEDPDFAADHTLVLVQVK